MSTLPIHDSPTTVAAHLPRITVITPTFNQFERLESTLQSVVEQGYPELEHFVIDGGSCDETPQIIQRHEQHLAGWTSQTFASEPEAINHGLHRATGQIVAVLRGGEVFLPGTLRHVAELMSGPDAADWLLGGCTIHDGHETIDRLQPHMPRSFLTYLTGVEGLLPRSACFWSARLFEDHGEFDPELRHAYDYEFHCRLLAGGERPRLIRRDLVAARAEDHMRPSHADVGLERLAVARRYAERLPLKQRYQLWLHADHRQRLYTLQQAVQSRADLLSQVARHPWWLVSPEVRTALLQSPSSRSAA